MEIRKKILMVVAVMTVLMIMTGKSLAYDPWTNWAFRRSSVNLFPLGDCCRSRNYAVGTAVEVGLAIYQDYRAEQQINRVVDAIAADREREEKARQQKAGMIYGVKINEATSSSGESKKIEKLQRENEKLKNDIQEMKDKAKDEQIEKLLKENTQLKKEAEIAAEEKARLKEGAENLLAASKELLLQRTPTAEPKTK